MQELSLANLTTAATKIQNISFSPRSEPRRPSPCEMGKMAAVSEWPVPRGYRLVGNMISAAPPLSQKARIFLAETG